MSGAFKMWLGCAVLGIIFAVLLATGRVNPDRPLSPSERVELVRYRYLSR